MSPAEAATPFGFAVLEEWRKPSDGPQAILLAIYPGGTLEQAQAYADAHASNLMLDELNVFRVTHDPTYTGDLDPSQWDVDVIVQPIMPGDINPAAPLLFEQEVRRG